MPGPIRQTAIKRQIAVVTGTRAEFGLLRAVMRAIARHDSLDLAVITTGTHLLPPQQTIEEVRAEFDIATTIAMQSPDQIGRDHDAKAFGRGVSGFADYFAQTAPDTVLVLGDRIEPFAAAAAASIAGIRVAHMHGGDRGEGIADESIRHAITKLTHVHFPATTTSAQRIIAMGEDPARVHVVGSPAIDGLSDIPPASNDLCDKLGKPEIIVLLHPVGDEDAVEHQRAAALLRLCKNTARTFALHPNHDPGRCGIAKAIEESGCLHRAHLSREQFIGLLRRAKLIVGNSSAGLIECSAILLRCLNVGSRQAGREKPANVIDVPDWDYQTIESSIQSALNIPPVRPSEINHPYGDGHCGERTAALLATLDFETHSLKKRNTY